MLGDAAMAALLIAASLKSGDEISRVRGHDVSVEADGSYTIRDIAGEGEPLVGIVERRKHELWLITTNRAYRLRGPLAIPRIAGPGYKVWALGPITGDTIQVRRIGVLRPPVKP